LKIFLSNTNSKRILVGTLPKPHQANAQTKALSKSLQADPRKKRNFKNAPPHREKKK